LKGLNSANKYLLILKNKRVILQGKYLMNSGLKIPVTKKQDSLIVKIEKID